MQDLRCEKCNKLLGKYRDCKQLEIKCPRCGARNYLQDEIACIKAINKPVDISSLSISAG